MRSGNCEELPPKTYQTLFYHATEPLFVVDVERGILLDANSRAEQLVGRSRNELIGQPQTSLFPQDLTDYVQELFSSHKNSDIPRPLQIELSVKDGERIPVQVQPRIQDIKGRKIMTLLFHDLRPELEVERALTEKGRAFQDLVEHAPVGIIIHDGHTVLYANDATRQIMRASSVEQIVGQPVERFIRPEDWDEAVQYIKKILEEKELLPPHEAYYVRLDGEVFPAEVSAFRMEYQGVPAVCLVGRDITYQKKQAEELAASELRYRTLFNISPVGTCITSSEGRILEANQALAESLGYQPGQLRGMHLKDISAPKYRRLIKPHIRRILQGEELEHEVQNIRSDGREVHFRLREKKIQLPDGTEAILTIAEDITTQYRMRRALEESEHRFRTIFHTNPDAVALNRLHDTLYVDVNEAFCEHIGYSREEIIGRTTWDLHIWDDFSDQERLFKLLQEKGEALNFQAVFRGKGGKRIVGLLSARIIKLAGVPYVLSITRDITERQAELEELQRYRESLEAIVAERTKDLESFTYSISHDLRAPLRAIHGFAKIILEEYGAQLESECRDYVQRICNNSLRLSELINGLLSLARVGQTDLRRIPIDMKELVQEAWEELNQQGRKSCRFIIEDLPNAYGDPVLLQQVWKNLLENAIKFTKETLKPNIRVKGERQGWEIIYQVEDNGIGFDPRYHDNLFQVFRRLHPDNNYAGTGIGLAIVQRIIQRHGGRIWAESQKSQGATFYFSLPVLPLKSAKES